MNFTDYFSKLSPEGKKDLATRLDVSLGYLYRIKGKFSSPSLELARRIQQETNGAVPLQDWHA